MLVRKALITNIQKFKYVITQNLIRFKENKSMQAFIIYYSKAVVLLEKITVSN